MKFKDYYETLGIERGASEEEIKKAYRRLARQYHPDISKEAGAEERFKEISEANQTLSDPEKRQAYDELGRHDPGEEFRPPADWDTRFWQGQAHQEVDLSELFEQMGFRSSQRRRQAGGVDFPIRGQDVEAVARLTLDEVSRGSQVTLERPGGGSVRIRVPQGVTDGERLRIPGRGGPGSGGGPDGDVYLHIQVLPHKLFRPVGHDLYLELPVTPWEAALGSQIELPSLDGRVRVTVKPGAQAGQKLRLAGKGLPKRGGGAGDLYAVLQIVMPTQISEREQELYRELATASTFQPRPQFTGGTTDA
ncbi:MULTISPECIES: DnaJ C-terminal domain-containing protein [unclassified Synechococcus]|uniref:DnaJ C-terminal domain-containing protein n=1 Tax=unclassified Synechococcus TaxID=2626047 RepID=UPI0000698EDA|nr:MULTISPECIES: DnaJ C-terminal domain-containing protein [unclassified Synechococcus]EAQ73904.1 curved DNA-binding protein [Synechococcus sp. WH 5701]MDM7937494.1 DnaJ C-terminal domain-containing protein [Cyanobium sp. CZS48M]WFN57919.1 DnaJ domain-containing protein [Synechococcus sp. CCFWC 502]